MGMSLWLNNSAWHVVVLTGTEIACGFGKASRIYVIQIYVASLITRINLQISWIQYFEHVTTAESSLKLPIHDNAAVIISSP